MRTNHSPRRMRAAVLGLSILVASAAALLVTGARAVTPPAAPEPAAALQNIRPWTAVGSTAAVDEASLNDFAFGGASFGFRAGSAATGLSARYNVTNTYDNNANTNAPGWTTLQLGSTAPAGTTVSAVLIQVNVCTGAQTSLCSTSNSGGGTVCTSCSFAPTPIDFTNLLYYVEVRVSRPAGSALLPLVNTVRVF